jgi:arylsulfatase A-like enzyme
MPRLAVVAAFVALILLLIVSLVRIEIPSRPVGDPSDLAEMRRRGDLNVVFILIDMLRADRLGSYGYGRPTSPTLDDIAATGIRFARVEAQSSWTKCSMASLWTGIFPPRTRVLRFHHALSDEARMPAELFREAGYVTAGLWRNGWVAPNFGFDQGFDLYVRPMARRDPGAFERRRPGERLGGSDEDITHPAVEFVRNHADERFLLYLHYMDVHQYTYDRTAADLGFGAGLSDSYDASIQWVDRNVRYVLQALDDLDLLKRTLVVVASDHGEAFREHGREGHARDLYREVVHVPLIFLLPFRFGEGIVVEPLVRNVDIWPTILDLVGLPPLPDSDGISLVPLIEAAARGEAPRTDVAVSYLDQTWGRTDADVEPAPLVAVTADSHRVILSARGANETLEIYDHAMDPGERHNLRDSPPDWAAGLQARAQEALKAPAAWGAPREVEINDMYRAQLRALGYVSE